MSLDSSPMGLCGLGKDSTPSGLSATSCSPTKAPAPRICCPFYARYSTAGITGRSCTGNGWPSTHRVKEHLYRKHGPPISCPRCHVVFEKQDDVNTHLKRDKICEKKPGAPNIHLNLLTEKQDVELRRKSRSKGEVSEEVRWNQIYRILFPDQTIIPSPYGNDAEARVRVEFEQHVRAKLFAELRTLFVGGVPKDSKYAGLRSQMKACIEYVFDSGLADEAFSRAANSFQRCRTSASEDEDLNNNLDHLMMPATKTAEPFGLQQNALASMQAGPWSPSLSTAFEMPISETFLSITPDDLDGGVSAYDKEQTDGSWLSGFSSENILQVPPLDPLEEPAVEIADQPVSFSSEVSMMNRKRKASPTPL